MTVQPSVSVFVASPLAGGIQSHRSGSVRDGPRAARIRRRTSRRPWQHAASTALVKPASYPV